MTRTDLRIAAAWAALATLFATALTVPREATAAPPGIRQYVTTIAPGLTLRRIVDLKTPRRIFVLTVDRTQPPTLDVTLARGDRLAGYARTSVMAANAGAIAAVNGDFTRSPGIPVHPFAADGELVHTSAIRGFGFAPTLDEESAFFDRPVQAVTATLTGTGEVLALDRWNDGPPAPGEIAGFSPAGGDAETPPAFACSVRLAPGGPPVAANPGTGVERDYTVDASACAATPMVVSGGVVLSAPPGTDEAVRLLSIPSGTPVRMAWTFGWPNVFDSIGGTPLLVADGKIALGECTGSVCHRHPRTGVGVTADGRVLLVVVDGRQPGWSVGLTMREFANLFRDLGAWYAMNLDGGGSSTVVVNGEVMNRPSDGNERAVGSAIVVLPGADPGEAFAAPSTSAAVPAVTGRPGRAALLDPGSTGGLLDALARGSFGWTGPLPDRLMRAVRLFRASL